MIDSAPNGNYVTARDLRRTYLMGKREVPVLRGVSIDVARGEFLALRGASGAGKSTLLHLLAGLDTPDAGEIRVAGRDLAGMSQRELARFRNEKVGLVFQAYHLLHEFDALENVCLAGRIGGKSVTGLMARGKDLLARVGLKDRFEHRPYELSGGEQQRVAIARALINEPELIIADEPTGNLDSHTGEEIVELLCALRDERNATLIIATHDNKVAGRAPRVVKLVDGQVETSPGA
jgi:predicted ABC-type transport system involved in lysophospholipase L1 biosynthesis ATPase subunit